MFSYPIGTVNNKLMKGKALRKHRVFLCSVLRLRYKLYINMCRLHYKLDFKSNLIKRTQEKYRKGRRLKFCGTCIGEKNELELLVFVVLFFLKLNSVKIW